MKGWTWNPRFKLRKESLSFSHLGFTHKGKRHRLIYDINDLILMIVRNNKVKVSEIY